MRDPCMQRKEIKMLNRVSNVIVICLLNDFLLAPCDRLIHLHFNFESRTNQIPLNSPQKVLFLALILSPARKRENKVVLESRSYKDISYEKNQYKYLKPQILSTFA